jgi:hypothetical protein
MDRIVERIIRIKYEPELIKTLFSWQGSIRRFKFAYVVYVNNSTKSFIEGTWSNSLSEVKRWVGFKKVLSIFLKKNNYLNFTDLLFFLDIYNRCKNYHIEISHIYDRKFKRNQIVDDILRDSRGFLLWDYQLKSLIRLFYLSNDVSEMYRGLLSHSKKHWNFTKNLMLGENFSLYNVLTDRMLLDEHVTVCAPRYKWALNLFNALRQKRQYEKDSYLRKS